MAHNITLTAEHQQILIEALYRSLQDKLDNRYRRSDPEQTRAQYADAAEKLLRPVTCGRKETNLFTWIQDQIDHSPGVRDTEICQRACLIARYAANNRYTEFAKTLEPIV